MERVGERMARCPGDDDEKLVTDAFGEAATPADGETADVQLQRLLRDFVNAHYTVEQQKKYPHLAIDLWNDGSAQATARVAGLADSAWT